MWAGLPDEDWESARLAFSGILTSGVEINVHRGESERARLFLARLGDLEHSADVQERGAYASSRAALLLGEGKASEALPMAESAFDTRDANGMTHEVVKASFVTAAEAAFKLGDRAKTEELLAVVEGLPPGAYPQFLRAHASRLRAKLAAQAGGSDRTDDMFKGAAGLFRELAAPFYLAVTEVEHSEWLTAQDRTDEAEPLLREAREIFERLEAKPWIERVDAVAPLVPTP